MHHNDTAVARITFNNRQHFLHTIAWIVVMGEHIPQINRLPCLMERFLLRILHASVRGTKQVGLQDNIRLLSVLQIGMGTGLKPFQMVVGMIAYGMSPSRTHEVFAKESAP